MFREPDKRRPVLILTRPSAIAFLTALTIAPITTTIRGIPTEVVLTKADGMFATCAVNTDNLQTVPKAKFSGFITHLKPEQMRAVRKAIQFALGFDKIL
jgi:mRNA interferase MazF